MVTVWELLEEWTQNTWEGISYIIQLSMDSRSDAHPTEWTEQRVTHAVMER
jgi:hypothetical protein